MSAPANYVRSRARRRPVWLTAGAMFLFILASVWTLIWFLFDSSRQALSDEIRDGLVRVTALISRDVDVAQHATLRDPAQEDGTVYATALAPLVRAQRMDDRIRFAYTAIRQDDQIFFILDTTPNDDEDAVALMELYNDPNPEIVEAFDSGEMVVSSEPYTDEWGTFLSAYTPLIDADGNVEGVMGLDLEVSQYAARLAPLRQASLLAAVLGFAFAIGGAVAVWWNRRSDRQARELSRQLRTVNAMLDVSRALGGEIQLSSLLQVVMAKISEVLDAERSSLFLYDKEENCLRALVTEGADVDWFTLPLDKGLAGRAARTSEVVNVADAYEEDDFNSDFDQQSGFRTRSVLAMPVRNAEGELIGVTQALNRRDGDPFDSDDETLMDALMAQAAVAIERARLTDAYVEKELIDEALRLAHDIQMSMLPKGFEEVGGEKLEIYASLTPAKGIGGDFYDFFRLDAHRVCLVVADVSGKGIPAALFMAQAKTLVHALAVSGLSAAETMERSNDVLCLDNDASMFVTVFFAIIDERTGTLTYSNAGHNLPCLIKPDGTITAIEGAEAIALAAMDGFPFEQAKLQLETGDVIYFYTDGVNEAMSETDEEFSQERLEAVLAESAGGSAEAISLATIEAVREHCGEAEASDDLTVLTIRWLGERRPDTASQIPGFSIGS
ncbi:MAG: SpoIIE family protein phosphatase [Pseudomonadota bacterium]